MKKRHPTKRRTLWAAMVAIAVAFVLTACGARIDTTMNVSDTGAGERVMVLNLSESDVSKLTGGAAAADASIRRHLPGSMSYSGLQPASGGGVTATLILAFGSTADYKKKSADLLLAGGTGEANIDFSVSDSILVKGITLRENHTSADLLKWMFKGLVSDGVVSSGDSSNMYELGTSAVKFGGATTQQSSTFNVKNVTNNGFDAVTMQTQIQDPNNVTRTVTYTVEDTRYAATKDVVAKFISESTPDGAKVAMPSTGTWTMTFTGDPASIASATTKALGGGGAEFALNLSDAPDDPSEKILTVTDNASCDAVCATSAPIIDTVTSASGYTPKNAEIDTSVQASTTFMYAPPISSVNASFHFGIDGSMDANVEFVIPKPSIDAVGDGFAKRLNPDEGIGTLKTTQNGSNTTYTVTISGKNAEEFTANYKKWAPNSSITADNKSESLFLHQTGYTISPALQNLTGRHAVTEGATSEIVLPFGQWVTNAGGGTQQAFDLAGVRITAEGLDSSFSVLSTGPTVGGLITAVILLAVIVIGVLLLVRHRRAVMVRLRTVRDRAGEALTEQRLLQFETNGHPQLAPETAAGTLFSLGPDGNRRAAGRSVLDMPARDHGASQRPDGSALNIPAPDARAPQGTSLFDLKGHPASETRPSLLN